jgi:hypothetical protein
MVSLPSSLDENGPSVISWILFVTSLVAIPIAFSYLNKYIAAYRIYFIARQLRGLEDV